MQFLLKKEDFILNKTTYSSEYEYENEDFKINISEKDFTDEELKFSTELVSAYFKNLIKIAEACKKSEVFKYCYPEENIESIIHKLGKPIFQRRGITTLLTYAEHTLDADHLLDIEFEGLYGDIFDIGIDG
uniref:Uncharacterized protein n=1 Tax=Histophilus somni (strain 129Pt) TaxID=205914 RepID=Q0I3J7_HISS1